MIFSDGSNNNIDDDILREATKVKPYLPKTCGSKTMKHTRNFTYN